MKRTIEEMKDDLASAKRREEHANMTAKRYEGKEQKAADTMTLAKDRKEVWEKRAKRAASRAGHIQATINRRTPKEADPLDIFMRSLLVSKVGVSPRSNCCPGCPKYKG